MALVKLYKKNLEMSGIRQPDAFLAMSKNVANDCHKMHHSVLLVAKH